MEKLRATKTASAAPHEFVIRPASVEDAAAILHCLRAAFEPYRPQYTPQAYLDTVMTPDTLLERLTSMTVLVAVDTRGNVVGTIGGAAVSPSEGHLRGMAVPPRWHGRGIAQRLLEAMEKHLLSKGCTRISLDTTEPLQRAMRFYEKHGFQRTGRVTDFFGMPLIEYVKLLGGTGTLAKRATFASTPVFTSLLSRLLLAHGPTSCSHPVLVDSGRIPGGFLRRSEMSKMSKKIRTWMVVSLVGAALLCGQAAIAQQDQDFSKVPIKTTKVSGNIYMLEGAGGNIAASVGEDGIVIVDDQFAPLAEKIQAALKELKITDKPVRFVINTHYHGDHTGGNVPFNNAGSTLIAQDNVRKRLESGGTAGNGSSIKMDVKPAPKAALPIITFEHDVTVHLNGEDIRALHFPSGHTDGDSIIFFPKNNVVHMGDDFVCYGFPFIDVASGGSVQGMIDAMEKATAQLPPDVKVIPGHGALSNLNDVRAFTKMLRETSAVVQKAINDHKTLEQMKQEKILAPWAKWNGDFVNEDAFIETLYNSLTGHKGEFVKHN